MACEVVRSLGYTACGLGATCSCIATDSLCRGEGGAVLHGRQTCNEQKKCRLVVSHQLRSKALASVQESSCQRLEKFFCACNSVPLCPHFRSVR